MNNKMYDEVISKRVVLEEIKKEMPINRMDTDEEVAMERLYHRILAGIERLPAEESELQREMRKRNMTEADILEYMKFEDACALKGFTLKGLLEAGEKMRSKKPYKALDKNRRVTWVNCPCCQRSLGEVEKIDLLSRDKHCKECGQELDWSDFRGTV